MIIMIPLNGKFQRFFLLHVFKEILISLGVIARIMKTLQKAQMKHKDSRTRLITEIVNNMKSIKYVVFHHLHKS